jgi:hypothetical protein
VRDVVRETRGLRSDLRDILREELAAFGHTFFTASTTTTTTAIAADNSNTLAADASLPQPKRRRIEDDTKQPSGQGEDEAAASVPMVMSGEKPTSETEADKGRSEAEERMLEREKELEQALEKEKQRAKAIEDEMKKVKRRTKIVYDRYGVLKKKKAETDELLKKAERENGDMRKANATFVEHNDTLAAQLREANEKATQSSLVVDKARTKAKAMKRQVQELTLFRERQAERLKTTEAERDEARGELETLDKRFRECSEERDRLAERADLLEKHNRDLLTRIDRATADVDKANTKLARRADTISRLTDQLQQQNNDDDESPAKKRKRQADGGDEEGDEQEDSHAASKRKNASNQEKENDNDEDEEEDDLSPLTGFTCLTATASTQGDPLACTPAYPLSVPLMDSQESEDIFGVEEVEEAEAPMPLASPTLGSDDDEAPEDEGRSSAA